MTVVASSSSAAPASPLSELPASELPVRELPASELPVRELPASDLPARDLPVRDLPDEDAVERAVTKFIYREARLQDEHDYDAWEALWADDGVYWIPANGDGGDPEREMSIVYDNRSRIALRIRQLKTGKRHSQSPRSALRRIVSNVEVLGRERDEIRAASNAFVYESNSRGETLWASRNEYLLRGEGRELRMVRKKVTLVNNQTALFTLSFLI